MNRRSSDVVVEPDGATGAENMAIDRALLEEAATRGTTTLRLYRFNPPCLSLGRNQPDVHVDGIDVVRRPTGGGAVWHEYEVTYAVAAPLAVFGSLRVAYQAIHEMIGTALRTLGVDATLAARRPVNPPTPVCFSASTGGEILASGRKLVGSAQVRQRAAFLQHGSILLDGTQEIVERLTGDVRRGTCDVYCTNLRSALGRIVSFDEVAEAVLQAWGGARIPHLQS